MQQPLTSDISIMIILYEKTENMLLIFLGFAMLKEKLVIPMMLRSLEEQKILRLNNKTYE